MSTPADIRDGIADAFEALRAEFFPESPLVKLIKISESAATYDDVLILEKWFLEYSDFRQNWLLQIADDSRDITEGVAAATHVSVDSDIYVIAKADTKPPQGTDVLWSLFCTRFFSRNQIKSVY